MVLPDCSQKHSRTSHTPVSIYKTLFDDIPNTPETTWDEVGPDMACDTNAGEIYLAKSPRQVPNLEACQKSCEDNASCQSISYSKVGSCDHFGTICTQTVFKNNMTSWRLLRQALDTTVVTTAKPETTAIRGIANNINTTAAAPVTGKTSIIYVYSLKHTYTHIHVHSCIFIHAYAYI